MASGTGKTLVGMWAAEQEAPKTVLVLLPSLTLLQQTLREWSKHSNNPFSYLAVCSDPTVGLKDEEDDDELNQTEVDFRIDTDPLIVRQFLEQPTPTTNIKVIFSTYHSSPIIGEGARGLPPFDFGIFDEAHKTTGYPSKFSYALSDQNIQIRKRLFPTTTPRHIDIRHRDKEGEFHIYSMDDETVYGPRAHTLTFGAAAEAGIICPYKVIVSVIDKKMVDDFARENGITLVEQDAIAVRWMAKLIVLQQAIKEVDAKKIITFHSRIATAEEFAKNEPRGIAYHLSDYEVRHINGRQNSEERREIIRAFTDAKKGLLTNARVLTEGIDVPAVDMVAFIDPRQSQIDITQAVGRAMRKPRGPTTKTFGYIVVPLFVDKRRKRTSSPQFKVRVLLQSLTFSTQCRSMTKTFSILSARLRNEREKVEPFNPRRLNEKAGDNRSFHRS